MNKFIFYSVLMLVVAIAGCWGGPIRTDKVLGQVTLDGIPLSKANINFHPIEDKMGLPSYAITNQDGEYKLQTLAGAPDAGTTPGEYIVTLTKIELVPTGRKVATPDGGKRDELKAKEFVPKVYTHSDTSPFKVTVSKGKKNVLNFELKSSGT